jgi:hypothetical protein
MRLRWEYIPCFGDRYRVSNHGQVESCHVKGTRGKRGEWWPLAQPKDRHGYPLVYLWDSAKSRRVRRLVHQLVAEAFVPNLCFRECVNHKNGRKDDNRAVNLEWISRADNMRHAWKTGLCVAPKLTAHDVLEIRRCGGTDTATAERFGVSQVLVTKIRANKIWRGIQP